MADPAQDALQRELGGAGRELPAMAELDAAQFKQLTAAIRAAKQHQRKALADALERSLQHVPALLRGVVRRVLIG